MNFIAEAAQGPRMSREKISSARLNKEERNEIR